MLGVGKWCFRDLIVLTELFVVVGNESRLGSAPSTMDNVRQFGSSDECGHGASVVCIEFLPNGTGVLVCNVIGHDGTGLGRNHDVFHDILEPVALLNIQGIIGDRVGLVDEMMEVLGLKGDGKFLLPALVVGFIAKFFEIGACRAVVLGSGGKVLFV